MIILFVVDEFIVNLFEFSVVILRVIILLVLNGVFGLAGMIDSCYGSYFW
jgi:hypothetical protein